MESGCGFPRVANILACKITPLIFYCFIRYKIEAFATLLQEKPASRDTKTLGRQSAERARVSEKLERFLN